MSVAKGKYNFHSRAGPLAQITNGGLTAARKNPLSDFNNAVLIGSQPLEDGKMFEVRIDSKVTSWSGSIAVGCTTAKPEAVSLPCSLSGFGQDSWIIQGSAIVKHGRQRISDYGRDIELLDVGDTVGMVRVGCNLNFFVNGKDQGTAESNLPPTVYPMVDLYGKCTQITIASPDVAASGGMAGSLVEGSLQFHKKCGKLVKLSTNGQTARRQNAANEYNNGVVMTNRPLKDAELFEIRITDMIDKWAGSIEVGITAHRPDTMELPATMTTLQSQTWVMSGASIVSGGKTLKENYGTSLDNLKVGDRVGVMRTENKEFCVVINGKDLGVAISSIPSSVYGVVDVYGRCTEVELVREGNIKTDAADMELARPSVSRDRNLCFSQYCGTNAVVSSDGRNVKRQTPDSEFTEASVFSNRPLKRNELFELTIKKTIDQWSGSLQMGVVAADPARLDFSELEEVVDLRDRVPVWMLSGQDLQHCEDEEEDEDEDVTYNLHLDLLTPGNRVGVMVNNAGELHYYLNGDDQGCAFTNIPEGVYAAIDIYGQCVEADMCYDDHSSVAEGSITTVPTPTIDTADVVVSTHQFHEHSSRNIRLTDSRTVASRVNSYDCGIVFSSRRLSNDELFEIQVKSIDKNWSGSLHIGLTSNSPPSDKRHLPEIATKLKDVWIASGSSSSAGNKLTKDKFKYISVLSKIQVADKIGVLRCSDATMHIYINGIDQGVACTGVTETPYGVVDVYGTTESVRIISIPSTPTIISRSGGAASAEGDASEFPLGQVLAFTYQYGKNISMTDSVVIRQGSYNHGMIVSDMLLPDDQLFQVEVCQVNTQWSGGLVVGVTSLDPYAAVQQSSATKLKTGTFVASGKGFTVNGNDCQDLQNYDLQLVKVGDKVGIVCKNTGHLLLYVNGHLKGKLSKETVPKLRHALVDLYGCCSQIKLLPLEQAPTITLKERDVTSRDDTGTKVKKSLSTALVSSSKSITEPKPMLVSKSASIPKVKVPVPKSVLSTTPIGEATVRLSSLKLTEPQQALEDVYNSLKCPYRQICKKFLDALTLPEAFFDHNPEYNLCYCENCLKGRKDKKVYERGVPPKKYTLPTGWTRFSLRTPPMAEARNAFKVWHVAFHGTRPENVRTILDTGGLVIPGAVVSGGDKVNQPEGHFTEEKKPKDFDVQQIFVSPSIKYCGYDVYAKPKLFQDPDTQKTHKCKVAFQVLIEPTSYKVGKETLGFGARTIDTEFKNSEIEWSTKQYGATILYGLLVKAEPTK